MAGGRSPGSLQDWQATSDTLWSQARRVCALPFSREACCYLSGKARVAGGSARRSPFPARVFPPLPLLFPLLLPLLQCPLLCAPASPVLAFLLIHLSFVIRLLSLIGPQVSRRSIGGTVIIRSGVNITPINRTQHPQSKADQHKACHSHGYSFRDRRARGTEKLIHGKERAKAMPRPKYLDTIFYMMRGLRPSASLKGRPPEMACNIEEFMSRNIEVDRLSYWPCTVSSPDAVPEPGTPRRVRS
jgi:hypothetical protein